MSFLIENDNVLVKYNEIFNKIKKTLNIKFHSKPFCDEKYIKTKVKEFNGAVNTVFFQKMKFQKKKSIIFAQQL